MSTPASMQMLHSGVRGGGLPAPRSDAAVGGGDGCGCGCGGGQGSGRTIGHNLEAGLSILDYHAEDPGASHPTTLVVLPSTKIWTWMPGPLMGTFSAKPEATFDRRMANHSLTVASLGFESLPSSIATRRALSFKSTSIFW